MQKEQKNKYYYVTNKSKLIVNIEDFDLFISPNKTICLNGPGFNFSIDDIEKSMKEGSLFKKKKFLFFGTGKSEIHEYNPIVAGNQARPRTVFVSTESFEIEKDLTSLEEDQNNQIASDNKFIQEMIDEDEIKISKIKKQQKL